MRSECHPEKDSVGRGLCRNCYARDWRRRNLESVARTAHRRVPDQRLASRKSQLRQYNLTQEQFDEIAENQGHVCAICYGVPTDGKPLSVDHDHACCPGKGSCGACVRGLLCNICNHMLGKARDSQDLLMRGAEYLEEHEQRDRTLSISDDPLAVWRL